jgi:chorismate mutase/prephenate dehydratase
MSRFAPTDKLVPESTLAKVFDSAYHNHTEYAVLPVENSTEGIVALTYHKLVEQHDNIRVRIQGEIYHPVSHHLCGIEKVEYDCIKYIHTKQEAWDQCREWVDRHTSGAQFVPESSTSHAAQVVRDRKEEGRAAICSGLAMQRCGLQPIAESIQDSRSNTTRFFIIGASPLPPSEQQTNWKVTLGIVLTDRVGAIADAFQIFKKKEVNVRSVKVSPVRAPELYTWKDWFFVDVLARDGGLAKVDEALRDLLALQDLVIRVTELGRYPIGDPREFSTGEAG